MVLYYRYCDAAAYRLNDKDGGVNIAYFRDDFLFIVFTLCDNMDMRYRIYSCARKKGMAINYLHW